MSARSLPLRVGVTIDKPGSWRPARAGRARGRGRGKAEPLIALVQTPWNPTGLCHQHSLAGLSER